MIATMSERPKKAGRPRRDGVPLHVYIPPSIKAAVDSLAERNRRTVTAEVLIALEAHLKQAGLWPPPEDQEAPEGE